MKKYSSYKMIMCALFASLICVGTMVVSIPSPLGGYVHLGDSLILMSAFLLGPMYAAFAAGVGSMLADILLGYMVYAPGTLIIKAGIAVIAALIYARIADDKKPALAAQIIAGIAGELFMIVGYYLYAATILSHGFGGALTSVPGNIGQALAGIIIAVVVTPLLLRSKEFKDMTLKFKG